MSPIKAGEGFVDLIPKPVAGFGATLAGAIKGELDKAGKQGSSIFANSLSRALPGNLGSLIGKGTFGNISKGIAEALGPGGVAGVGVAAGGLAIAGIADEAAKLAHEAAGATERVRDLQRVVGGSAEDNSRLVATLDAIGVSADKVGRPLLTLATNLHAGGGKLKEYFSAAEIAKLRNEDLSKSLPILAEKYKSLAPGVERDAFVVAAFSKRGAELNKILAESPEHLDAIAKHAERAGLIFSQSELDRGHQFLINTRELQSTAEGLKVQLGNLAIPPLSNAITNIDSGILSVEGAVHKVGNAFDKLPGPVQRGLGTGAHAAIVGTLPFLEIFFHHAKNINDELDKTPKTLGDIENSAADDANAAKAMEAAFRDAFSIADKVAADFDKRLDSLVPKIDAAFAGAKTPEQIRDDASKAADAVTSAADRVSSAQDAVRAAQERIAENERFLVRTPERDRELATARAELAKAERDYAAAQKDSAKAETDAANAQAALRDPTKAIKAVSVTDLASQIRGSTDLLNRFTGDITKISSKLKDVSPQARESFLAGLVDLGPAAVPLLDQLVRLSDKELDKFAGMFSNQIAAAKRAADLQFDKFPPNFTEKIGAARKAGEQELDKLVSAFDALPDKSDPSGAWAKKLNDMALAIDAMAQQGIIALTPIEREFLNTAESADTADEKASALRDLINSLEGKRVDVDVAVHDEQLQALIDSLKKVPFGRIFLDAIIGPPHEEGTPPGEGGFVGEPAAGGVVPGSEADQNIRGHRQSGGDVTPGRWWVGEAGPEILQIPADGFIWPSGTSPWASQGPTQQVKQNKFYVDKVVAQDARHIQDALERKARLSALVDG